MKKRILALFLVLVLCMGLLPVTALADENAQTPATARISFTAQAENAFLCAPQLELTVSGDLAENYGYTDSIAPTTGVSALDVLVKAHQVIFEKAFTVEDKADYLVVNNGSISTIFGVPTGSCGFAVNGAQPHDDVLSEDAYAPGGHSYGGRNISQAAVTDGDLVEFWIYQDSYAMDYYPVISKNGANVTALSGSTGAELALTVEGYSIGWYGLAPMEALLSSGQLEAAEDAQLAWVNMESGALTPISGAVVDEEGAVSLTLPGTAGTHYLTVFMPDEEIEENYATPLLLPLIPVTVSAASAPQPAGSTADWAGIGNFNDANNYVTDVALPLPGLGVEKWAYRLSAVAASGAYYAGQPVIADGYLYATGGGKLHKVALDTGVGEIINENAGVTTSFYDYLCYADGTLVVASGSKLEAFSTDGASLGSVAGSFGDYHPVQYHDGYVICNGFIYRLTVSGSTATFTQVGDAAIGGDTFNWSSGAFVGGKFYVASKTKVYAVDYTTNTVAASYEFDSGRTATKNTQGGVVYDSATKRLFWGTYSYNSEIHSIQINDDGSLNEASYLHVDAGEKSVCTPVVYGGKVYLAGQTGKVAVRSAADLSEVYTEAPAKNNKVQCVPILSTAGGVVRLYFQRYDGAMYVLTDTGSDHSVALVAATRNPSNVTYPNAGYEQIAMDKNGNLYCYNESGYLFCIAAAECDVPAIGTDLSTQRVKYAVDGAAEALTVAATVSDGGVLSYQWQSSADNVSWTNVNGAAQASYTPSTAAAGTTYYRCVVTNTKDGHTASAISKAAWVLVKVLSTDTTLNAMVNGSNSVTGGNPAKAAANDKGILVASGYTQSVTNIWLGAVDEGSIKSLEVLQGLTGNLGNFTAKTSANVYDGTAYNGYYRIASGASITLPLVAKATVTAEDGETEQAHYIVVYNEESSLGLATELTLSRSALSLAADAAAQTLTATAASKLGTGTTETLTWTSSNPAVATVDQNGAVTPVGAGTAVITAAGLLTDASCTVTVTGGTKTVTVAVYDYNAGAAQLAHASQNGVIFEQQVTVAADATAAQVLQAAADAAQVSVTITEGNWGPYLSAVGDLAAGDGGGSSGWSMVCGNEFPSVGMGSLTLSSGDRLEFHYTMDYEDVGSGVIVVKSFTLAGVTVNMKKETAYDEQWNATTTYYLQKADESWEAMSGSGSQNDPFIIPMTLPAGTSLTALTASYTTNVGTQYRTVTGLTGAQDYTSGHSFSVAANIGSNAVYYKVTASVASSGGTGSTTPAEDTITVSFRLIGATRSTGDVDVANKDFKGAEYVTWLKTSSFTVAKDATVGDVFQQALDAAGLSYSGLAEGYIRSITAPAACGGYVLAELNNGPNSGWMYTLNGAHSELGLNDQTLRSGDKIVWHYVNDSHYEVEDWSGNSLGDSSVWSLWLKAADTTPTASAQGGSTGSAGSSSDKKDEVSLPEAEVEIITGAAGETVAKVTVPAGADAAKVKVPVSEKDGGNVVVIVNADGSETIVKKSVVDEDIAKAIVDGSCTVKIVDNSKDFTDVSDGAWYAGDVDFASSHELFQGVSETRFAPEAQMTRAMLATVLFRLEDAAATGSNSFADVPAGAYYTDAVTWANGAGIVQGYGNSFGSEDNITRQDLATMLFRYAKTVGMDTAVRGDMGLFNDTGKVSDYADDAMRWAVGMGIIGGKGNGVLDPKGNATRAEVAAMLQRLVKIMVK